MPYQPGHRLPGERASKIGHLEVLKNPLVTELCKTFKDASPDATGTTAKWEGIPKAKEPQNLVFAVDGSWQSITSDAPPYSVRAFIKTALLRLDQYALAQIDKESPHPFALRDILQDSAMYHATVFPLRHVVKEGVSVYDAMREVI